MHQKEKDLRNAIDTAIYKFEYSFTYLIFAILAFSYQFSPRQGNLWPYSIIISWICLFFSGCIGGWRLQTYSKTLILEFNKAREALNSLEKKRGNWAKVQVGFFFLGVIVQGIYSAKNLLP